MRRGSCKQSAGFRITKEELDKLIDELRDALRTSDTVVAARHALDQLLVPRGTKLFTAAIELAYTFPVSPSSPHTGSDRVPAAGFEPAIFTLKG